MRRCEVILDQFLTDENDLGECLLPVVRIDETIYVLKELARLVIDSNAASFLSLHPNLTESVRKNENIGSRAHLLLLYPSFCELVVSREACEKTLLEQNLVY
ncbi:protein MON2-like protein isoform X3 [Iris pallida]|uniref:Protein MON2-like protein isoform X3 n=1 Tax=Iris pallida TaxID=29817 RepID=A0AAX6I376_IRIPA|nr:protein MON2-like protein isoform X3 [Iris pallida]KAJ6847746.1 protein MON2-like protein isoform X3 [Iris pallida]